MAIIVNTKTLMFTSKIEDINLLMAFMKYLVLSIKKLLNGEIGQLSRYEKSLSFGPWIFSPSSPFRLIQAINGFGAQAWFYQQIKRISLNEDPDLSMSVFAALRKDLAEDVAAVKALKG